MIEGLTIQEVIRHMQFAKRLDSEFENKLTNKVMEFKAYWVGENLIRIDIPIKKELK